MSHCIKGDVWGQDKQVKSYSTKFSNNVIYLSHEPYSPTNYNFLTGPSHHICLLYWAIASLTYTTVSLITNTYQNLT